MNSLLVGCAWGKSAYKPQLDSRTLAWVPSPLRPELALGAVRGRPPRDVGTLHCQGTGRSYDDVQTTVAGVHIDAIWG